MNKTLLSLAALALIAIASPTTAYVPVVTDHIVISEFSSNAVGSNETGLEWIEIHNPTLADADLSGWIVHDLDPCGAPLSVHGKYVFDQGTTLASGAFLQVFMTAASRVCLANGGDDIHLVDSLNNTIDQVWYGNGGDLGADGATFAPAETQSVARCHLVRADGLNADEDSPVREFYLEIEPTPGAANDPCLPTLI